MKRALAIGLLALLAVPAVADDVGTGEDAFVEGVAVGPRLDEIRRRIQAAVVYPKTARARRLEGIATVGFEIDRASGLAQGIRLVDSSGHPSLDRAAERSVVRAGELPWVYGHLEVPVRFHLADAR
jgi:TonB family protein